MRTAALLLFFCAAGTSFGDSVQIAPLAPQEIPQVHTLRKIVTLAGMGTRTYWATAKESAKPQTILKVRQEDGTDKIFYLPDPYRPNDLFRRDIDTPVVVTGTVTVQDGKNYLFPYAATEQK